MGRRRSGLTAVAAILLALSGGLIMSGEASAAKPPLIYEQARAIPTRSGENVRITLFTNRVNFIKARVNGGESLRPSRFGRGCGKLRCQKWKLYSERVAENECYEIKIYGRSGSGSAVTRLTVCEPFPDGSV